MDLAITKRQFRDWLKSKAPDAVVGQGGSPYNCPLARCISELHPPHVGYANRCELALLEQGSHRVLRGGVYGGWTRPWAYKFIGGVGSLHPDSDLHPLVTAAQALTLLRRL